MTLQKLFSNTISTSTLAGTYLHTQRKRSNYGKALCSRTQVSKQFDEIHIIQRVQKIPFLVPTVKMVHVLQHATRPARLPPDCEFSIQIHTHPMWPLSETVTKEGLSFVRMCTEQMIEWPMNRLIGFRVCSLPWQPWRKFSSQEPYRWSDPHLWPL